MDATTRSAWSRSDGSTGISANTGRPQVTASAHSLRDLFALAGPLILSRAGLAAMTIVTAVLVAHVDAGQLAAISLAEGTLGRLIDVGIAFVASALVLFPSTGANGGNGMRLALWLRTLKCALAFGLVAAIVAVFGPLWLPLIGQSGALGAETARLLPFIGLGAPAALIAIASAIYLEGTGRARAVAIIVIAANVVNGMLGLVLVWGTLGAPVLGATGAVITSLAVRIAMAVVLVTMVLRTRDFTRESPRALDTATSTKHWRVGFSAGTSAAALHTMGLVLTSLAGWLGALEVAAYASIWIINMPGMLVAFGLAEAIGVRVARHAGQPSRGPLLRLDLAVLSLLIALLAGGMALFAGFIAAAYTKDPALQVVIAAVLPMSASVLLLDALAIACISTLRSFGDTLLPMGVQLLTVVLTPLLALLFVLHPMQPFPTGVAGMVFAILLTSTLRLGLLGWRLVRVARPNLLADLRT